MKTFAYRSALGAVILIAAMLAIDAQAEGLRVELGAGQCQQARAGKGSWWNDHYATRLDLVDDCHQLGLSATPWQWKGADIGWRFAYVNLGRTKIDSVMAYRDDEQFSNPDGTGCDWLNEGRGCLIDVMGGGRARGFSLGAIAERSFGGLTVGVEGGGFVYYNHFTVYVDSHPNGQTPAGHWLPARWDMARGWVGTTYLGANLRYGWLTAAVRTYAKITAHQSGCPGCSGVTNGEAWQVNVGLSIPVDL